MNNVCEPERAPRCMKQFCMYMFVIISVSIKISEHAHTNRHTYGHISKYASSAKSIIMPIEKDAIPMETSPHYSSAECQTKERRTALHRKVQRRYRQAISLRETAEQKRERWVGKNEWQKKKRGSETGDSTTTRLKQTYTSTYRSKESDCQRRVRLAIMRKRARQMIDQQTEIETISWYEHKQSIHQ